MLLVTPKAKDELLEMLLRIRSEHSEALATAADSGFRIVTSRGDNTALSLTVDAPRAGDRIVEHQGCTLLIVDALLYDLVDELTVDVVETPQGVQLAIR